MSEEKLQELLPEMERLTLYSRKGVENFVKSVTAANKAGDMEVLNSLREAAIMQASVIEILVAMTDYAHTGLSVDDTEAKAKCAAQLKAHQKKIQTAYEHLGPKDSLILDSTGQSVSNKIIF